MRFPVFDLHCDTAFAMLGTNGGDQQSLLNNTLHIDWERAKNLPGYAQCFACFTSEPEVMSVNMDPRVLLREEYGCITKNFDSIKIRQAMSVEDVLDNYRNGVMSGILTLEGTAGIRYDPAILDAIYDCGFRITTLGWNEKNPLTGSHATGGGLTELGRSYIQTAQSLGMLIDVSHISDEAFWDVMTITNAPIIASHSNSRSICNVSRNLTDEMFRAICRTGGVAGINLYAAFLGENADLNTVCDHMIHFLSMDPGGRHICLGGDLDGCDQLPAGFRGIEDYQKLADTMACRGLSDDIIYNIFWNNAVELFQSLQRMKE